MKIVKLTDEEIHIIKVWLCTYEPYLDNSEKKTNREQLVIDNIFRKLK